MSATGKALNQAGRHLHGETRLADSARTRDRDQARILSQQEFFGCSYFSLPTHKAGSLHGKVGPAGFRLLSLLL